MTTRISKRLDYLSKSINPTAQDLEKSRDELLSEIAFIDGALDAAIDSFVIFDLKGRPLKWNRAVAEITGYSDEELGSLKVTDLVAEEYRGDVAKTLKKTLKDGRATMEVEVVRKNGDRIPLEFTGAVLKDKKDKPIGLCAIGRGITERKKAEEELAESELKFKTLFDNASDAIFIHDLKGHFIEVNRVAVERLGYSRKELLSMTPMDIDSPEFAEMVPPRIKALQEKGSAIFETAHVTKEGKLIPVEASSRIIEFQGQECILTIARDITERKKAEKALRESESKHRFLTENINDVMWTVDLNMNPTYVSPSIEKVLGFTPEERLRQNATEQLTPESFELASKTLIEELQRDGEEGVSPDRVVVLELDFPHKDGHIVSLETIMSFIRDQNGNPVGIHGLARDVTERKRAEEELRESEERYRQIFENAIEGIFRSTPEGTLTSVNPAFARMYGYASPERMKQEVTNIAAQLYFDPAEREGITRLVAEKGFVQGMEVRYKRRDGTALWVMLNAHIVRDAEGNILYFEGTTGDITERRRAEQALRESKEELQTIYEGIGDGVMVVDLEAGTILRANPALASMLGYSQEELTGMAVIDVHPPEELQRVGQELEKGRRGENRIQDLACLRKDGSTFPADMTGMTINYLGRTCGVAVFKDVTERKRAEEEIRTEKALTDAALDTTQDMFVLFDLDGKFVRWNKKSLEVTGRTDAEVAAMTPTDFFTSEDAQRIAEGIARSINEGHAVETADVVAADGSRTPTEWTGTLLKDSKGNPTGVVAIGRDVTERKKAEQELEQSEMQFRRLFDLAPVGLATVDPDGLIIEANTTLAELLKADMEDVVGSSIADWISPESTEAALSSHEAAVETGELRKYFEANIQNSEGEALSIIASSEVLTEDPFVVMTAVTDITARKQAENQLNETLKELARSNAELEEFAYAASHDLQEPLRMVSSYVQLLERRYKDKLDSDADDFIGFAVDGVHRMQSLINDLLEYSRVGMRGKPLEPIDAATALDKALDNLQIAIDESGALITSDGLPTVTADETQLIQLFQNLIGNAINFRGDDTPRIHISANRKADEYLFSIRDNGIGIDPGQSERIFQIFQSLHTRTERSGTGIGLAVCERIVERHGGLIWVESEPGRGSTFFFTLPIRKNEEQ